MPHSHEVCGNCVHWHGCANNFGRCHRYPPQLFVIGGTVHSDFPNMPKDDWCGEFKCTDSPLYLPDLDDPADPAISAAG